MPEVGAALARLGGGPADNNGIAPIGNGIAPLSGSDSINIDFANPGMIPDFGWLGGSPSVAAPAGSAQAPAVGAIGDTKGPGSTATMDKPGDVGQAQGNEGSWSAQDEQMLDKAISGAAGGSGGAPAVAGAGATGGADDAKYDKIFSQFGQSQEGNCASVAVIKAALDKYKGKVFQEVKKSGDGYDIKMQDGKSVKVAKGDLQKGAKEAKFKGEPSEVKSMAILMFTAMAKRGAEEGGGSMDAVLKDMNNGFDPKKSAQLLGLGQKIKQVDPNSSEDGVVAWNDRHAVYQDSGKADSYGTAKAANGTDTRGGKLTQAFTFA
jgi:hypothetical protein